MSLVDLLLNDDIWQKFLEHKKRAVMSSIEIRKYEEYINNKRYKDISKKIVNEQYVFSIPRKIMINKIRKAKKRIVYSYSKEETYVLKMLSFLLYEYDYLFAPNVYSFRQNSGVKKAITNLVHGNIKTKYAYKVDIRNYFNSVPVLKLLENLKKDLKDEKLYNLLYTLLMNKKVFYGGEIIEEEKGIMAGVPISSFLANYYLRDLDFYFYNNKVTYCRYADDIIVFDTEEKVKQHREYILNYLSQMGLAVNKEKEFFYSPREQIEFLGFSYNNGIIDLGRNSIRKIKDKIRRAGRGLRRWSLKKELPPEAPLKAMNKKFNKKFFGKEEDDLSWKYWFFPTINTDKSLKMIDKYMQEWQRYIVTGVHNKKNFEKVPYKMLKECNYRSLVNEYYETKKTHTDCTEPKKLDSIN